MRNPASSRLIGVPSREFAAQSSGFLLPLGALALISTINDQKKASMLWTIAVLLLILWAIGLVSSYTLGGFIHILLVLAIIAVLVRIIQGRRPVF
jgi:predicted membrane protein